jgi:hypothetical protein
MIQKDDTRTHTKMKLLNHAEIEFVHQSLEFDVDFIFA